MSDYRYPSDLDSDEGSIVWEQEDGDEGHGTDIDDSADVDSLASSLNGMGVGGDSSEDDLDPTPGICIWCNKRPVYKTYPTCGVRCGAKYQEYVASQRTPARQKSVPSSSRQRTPGSSRQQSANATDGSATRARRLLPSPPRSPCAVCRKRPSYRDRVTCGLACAEKLNTHGGDPILCTYCHAKPRNGNQPQCGQTCAEKAKLACLYCRCRPRNGRYHLCGKTCKKLSTKNTPLLLEAPQGHATFDMVETKFKKAWKSSQVSVCPEIKKVFKIIENHEFLRPYDAYRKQKQNEHFRYHGTKQVCTLGKDGGTTKVCANTGCSVCSILKTSFKVSLANPGGAFGAGVYSSSASNKAFSYCGAGGSMLLNKVVLGNVKQVNGWNEVMACPPEFDSVVFDRQGGVLNETIVYRDDAIRPVFLISF